MLIIIPTGNVTYQVVANDNYHQSSGLQLLNNGSGGGGQYYVVSSGVPRSQVIDPRNFGRVVKANARDDKKRATHNEVERRRRDKINGWIGKLAKIVPSCADEAVSKNQVLFNTNQVYPFFFARFLKNCVNFFTE